MKMSELDDYIRDNPNYENIPCTRVNLVSGVAIGTSLKPDESFREVLRHIKKNNIRSNINTF